MALRGRYVMLCITLFLKTILTYASASLDWIEAIMFSTCPSVRPSVRCEHDIHYSERTR